jgi:hypothetical protein
MIGNLIEYKKITLLADYKGQFASYIPISYKQIALKPDNYGYFLSKCHTQIFIGLVVDAYTTSDNNRIYKLEIINRDNDIEYIEIDSFQLVKIVNYKK